MGIRIPDFSALQDRGSSEPNRELSANLTLGFGLHWTWVYVTMYAASHVFLPGITDAQLGSTRFYIISMIFLVLTVGLIGVFCERVSPYLNRRATLITAACIMSAGTIFLFLAGLIPYAAPVFAAIAGALTGIGSGSLLLCWGDAYRRRETPAMVMNAAFAIIFAFVLYALIISQLPYPFGALVTCILPFIEVTFLLSVLQRRRLCSQAKSSLLDDSEYRDEEKRQEESRPDPNCLSEMPTFQKLRVHKSAFALKIGTSAFIFGLALGSLREFALKSTLSASDPTSQIILVAGSGLAALLLIGSTLFLKNDGFDSYYRAFVPFIAIILLLIPSLTSGNHVIANLILFVGCICFELMMWVAFAEIAHRYRLSALLVFGFGRAFLTTGTLVGVLAAQALETPNGLFALGDGDGALGSTLMIVALLIGYCLLPRERDIKAMVIPDEVEEKLATDSWEDSVAVRQGRFVRRCERIANTYLLSNRETEVLYLLAKGRNAAFIQKKLFISEGTARTHIWRIYKKLDIHTQQELIDMIDER